MWNWKSFVIQKVTLINTQLFSSGLLDFYLKLFSFLCMVSISRKLNEKTNTGKFDKGKNKQMNKQKQPEKCVQKRLLQANLEYCYLSSLPVTFSRASIHILTPDFNGDFRYFYIEVQLPNTSVVNKNMQVIILGYQLNFSDK